MPKKFTYNKQHFISKLDSLGPENKTVSLVVPYCSDKSIKQLNRIVSKVTPLALVRLLLPSNLSTRDEVYFKTQITNTYS